MIPLMKNTFLREYETKQALADFLIKAHRLSMDTKCAEFEMKFAEKQGRRHAVLFNSGGSANLAIFQAMCNLGRLKRGDRIGFSALTWSTNTMPIIQMGMEPVPIDCEIETLNVMSDDLNRRLEETGLEAVFITNALGFTGDLPAIARNCAERGIPLIEDNCEALGTCLPEGRAGNFGLCASFSFFVAHHMSTIEGGMVCTDDADLDEMLRIVRANGWDRNLPAVRQHRLRKLHKIDSEYEAKYTFYDLGFNMRPTEVTGFLGLYQLQYLDENIAIRRKNHLLLERVANDNDELVPLDHRHISELSPFAYPIICRTAQLRDEYLARFSGAGIEVRPMIAGNIQRQPFYKKYVARNFDLPKTDGIHTRGFYCGNYPELSQSDLETISSCLYRS